VPLKQPIDIFDHNLVEYEEIDSELECQICYFPYLNPYEHEGCNHIFCHECISKCKTCPICRGSISGKGSLRQVKTRLVKTMLDKITVTCKACEKNISRSLYVEHYNNECLFDCNYHCNSKISINNQAEHYSKCDNMDIDCTNEGCRVVIKRKDLVDHFLVCEFMKAPCQYECGKMIRRKNMEDHLKECSNAPCICEYCSCEFKRKDMEVHLDVCLFKKVECKGSVLGCNYIGMRSDMDKHNIECIYFKMYPAFQGILDKVQHLEKKVSRMKNEIDDLKKKKK